MQSSSAAARSSPRPAAWAATHEPYTGRPSTRATIGSSGPAGRASIDGSGRFDRRRRRRRRAAAVAGGEREQGGGEGPHQSRCTRASRAISLPTEITASPIDMTRSAPT